MREQLIQYVELLFAGARDCEDIKQEILQNTLDRYDDLVAEGKVPEAAYRLAITGIGDINEILGTTRQTAPFYPTPAEAEKRREQDTSTKKILRTCAIGLYIICFIPLFILSEMGMSTIGLCGTLAIVAVATCLMILGAKKRESNSPMAEKNEPEPLTPQQELRKSVDSMIWAIGVALYFIISFATMAWHITWVIFPLVAAVQGLARAILGDHSPKQFRKSISSLIWAVGLALYFIISFATGAWFVTWVIFPIIGAVQGLVKAILDLMEASEYET